MNFRFVVSILLIVLLTCTAVAQVKRHVKTAKVKDPVCGLMVDKDPELSVKYAGATYYFCSKADMAQFRRHPAKYAKKIDDRSMFDSSRFGPAWARRVDIGAE